MKKKFVVYFKMLKLHRILSAFSIFRKEGLAGIKYHFYLVKDKEKGLEKDCGREYDITPVSEDETENGKEDMPLSFEKCTEPLVSIMIPVYNQFAYTYHCLMHIKKYGGDIAYEIIVGDDCSSDKTEELEKAVKGIRVIHHERNYQFLMNCNRISKKARGKYLVFLNNDTQVQKGWLEALVNLMEEDQVIGLAGSKFIYPTGLVQEAGGIVWKDASVLQFGNNRQPGEEELNIRREADYISGASIMIRKELWDEIGGFDERFVPAYYEDVDLAFQVRERGYKVVYQPESEVVHFEGVTEGGTQEEDERKKKQIERNREKFAAKWGKILREQHYEAGEYPRLAEKIRQGK